VVDLVLDQEASAPIAARLIDDDMRDRRFLLQGMFNTFAAHLTGSKNNLTFAGKRGHACWIATAKNYLQANDWDQCTGNNGGRGTSQRQKLWEQPLGKVFF